MTSSPLAPFLPARGTRRSLARITRRHRRPLAAALIVLALASAIRPAADARGVTGRALALNRSLEAGDVVTSDDVVEVAVPAEALADDALTDASQVVGARLTVAASAREVLTPARLVGIDGSLPFGKVVAPVRLADAQVASLLRVGDLVDVLAASSSSTLRPASSQGATAVAVGARVVATPSSSTSSARRSGLFGSTPGGSDGGGLLLLAVEADTAARLAGAAATSRLSIVLRPEN